MKKEANQPISEVVLSDEEMTAVLAMQGPIIKSLSDKNIQLTEQIGALEQQVAGLKSGNWKTSAYDRLRRDFEEFMKAHNIVVYVRDGGEDDDE